MAAFIVGTGNREPSGSSQVITFCPESSKKQTTDSFVPEEFTNILKEADIGLDSSGKFGEVASFTLRDVSITDDLMTAYDVVGGVVQQYLEPSNKTKQTFDDFSAKYFKTLEANRSIQLGPYDAFTHVYAAPVFSKERYRELMEYQSKRVGPPRLEGLYRCKKCKSMHTYSYPLQTRSADEPTSTIVICIDCGHRYKTD